MKLERNLTKRENRFFKTIITKLQRQNEFSAIWNGESRRDNISQKQHCATNIFQSKMNTAATNADFHAEYKLKQKFFVNISKCCNNPNPVDQHASYANPRLIISSHNTFNKQFLFTPLANKNKQFITPGDGQLYKTISDDSVFDDNALTKCGGSCSSLKPNLSSISLTAAKELSTLHSLKLFKVLNISYFIT